MASISSAAQSVSLSSTIDVTYAGGQYYRTSNTKTGSVTCSVSVPSGSSISSSTFSCSTTGGTLYGGTTKINNTTVTGTGPHVVETGAVTSVTIPLSFKSIATSGGGGTTPQSDYTQTRTFSDCILTVNYTPPSAPSVSDGRLGNSTSTQYAGAGAGVTLSWSAANGTNNAISSYTIQRSANGGAYLDLATGVTSGSYTVYAHATPGNSYRYQVIAVAPYGNSAAAVSPLLYTYSAVSIPTGLSISPNKVFPNASVTLSWTASSGGTGTSVTGYNVLQNGTVIAGLTGTSYIFAAPVQGSYTYTVQAVAYVSGYNSAASAGAALTVDPPASNFELNRATVEMDGTSVITATIDPINSAYNHDVTFVLDATRTSTANVAAGSKTRSFTVPLAWCVGVPNATSATATCTVVTKNGAAVIGSLSTNFTVTVPASVVPGAALSVAVVDGFNGLYLKGKSKCLLTSTFTGAQGSTLASQALTGGGYSGASSPFTTGILNTAGTQAMSVTVTDSRSRQKTASQNITVTEYASPSILNVSAYRSDAAGNLLDTGGNIAVTASFLVAAIAGNSGTGTIRKRIAGGTWETAVAITHNTKVVLTGALPENAYEVEITLIDTVGTASIYSTTIRQAQFAFDFRNDRAALGRLATDAKTLNLPDDWTTNINADKLDGNHASAFAKAGHAHTSGFYSSDVQSNLDTFWGNGAFGFLDSTVGKPEAYGQGIAISSSGTAYNGSNNWITQLAFGTTGSTGYFRTRVNAGGWGPWYSLLHSGNFLNYVYPVNSVYISYSSTSPASLFGGTWSALPSGRFLRLGTGGSTGGSDTHAHTTAAMTLALSQIPYHRHVGEYVYNPAFSGAGYYAYMLSGNRVDNGVVGYAGGGGSHGHGDTGGASNVPAYYEVYAWRRTA